ncbi:MAG: chemotaxis protein MotB [Brevundimonas sp.]|uniref:OmpA family protein n=1 Tax=Brevundimonas albigilva TaxID=1312364 RepID=A0ABY4SPG6_9CAUL|nr:MULTISPECIES: flagellar motor protein MotB [Brevundimonas]MCV0413705.1 OmpA family protein [Brevundimonas sp.]PZU58997.1 MAG: chemotaxis protein MotB [Brevundimonas sp.]UQV18343.1 OmpA family protein [Brevundimonas albigilva]URI16797.1 OmpA family protein [Brevundimonas albigilva]
MSVSDRPILIKKVKKGGGHGHHGGAWKVAYADFVTAMMAFFLLMWLVNATDPEQKKGIAEYFAPASVSETTSGSGGILGGTALGDDGPKSSGSMSVIEQLAPEAPPDATQAGPSSNLSSASDAALEAEMRRREADQFASAAESLRQAMQSMPELAELSKQLIVDQTPEGLRIQLVDQEGRSMFDNNSAQPNARAQVLLRAVARVINQLPNRISITGHTSAVAGSGRASGPGDWTLSSARANASRLVLQGAGVDPDRVYSVAGKAGSDPLYPDDPSLAGNRRISIVLLREAPVLPMDTSL